MSDSIMAPLIASSLLLIAIFGFHSMYRDWRSLARRFPDRSFVPVDSFAASGAGVGPTFFISGVFVKLGDHGLRLSMSGFYRFSAPGIVVPWSEVARSRREVIDPDRRRPKVKALVLEHEKCPLAVTLFDHHKEEQFLQAVEKYLRPQEVA